MSFPCSLPFSLHHTHCNTALIYRATQGEHPWPTSYRVHGSRRGRVAAVRARIRSVTGHWVWELVQLGLSILSCLSYLFYTYAGAWRTRLPSRPRPRNMMLCFLRHERAVHRAVCGLALLMHACIIEVNAGVNEMVSITV